MKEKDKKSFANITIAIMSVIAFILFVCFIVPHWVDVATQEEEIINISNENDNEYVYSIQNTSFEEYKHLYLQGKVKLNIIT